MSDKPTEDTIDQDLTHDRDAEVECDVESEVESDELPLTPKMMAMMTLTMFVGFVVFVAVCLPLYFFD